MSHIREFELEAYKNRKEEKFKTLIYLCLGQESIYASASEAIKKASIFGQHRGHGIYIAYGGRPHKLVDELIGLTTGTNKGMGGSPPIFDRKIGMFGHVGLIGDQVPVAAGYALVNKKKITITFFGDGAAEEDYVLATFGFAKKNSLKILFICDDNDLSVLTPTKDRRSWNISEIAKSFGIKSMDITDDPLTIYKSINSLKSNLPALLNIRTCREFWHEGAGKDKPGKNSWNRYKIFKKKLIDLGLEKFVTQTEIKNKKWSEKLWQKQLRKL
jgi:pyruvate dehydrogenase E1 component alpha subunit